MRCVSFTCNRLLVQLIQLNHRLCRFLRIHTNNPPVEESLVIWGLPLINWSHLAASFRTWSGIQWKLILLIPQKREIFPSFPSSQRVFSLSYFSGFRLCNCLQSKQSPVHAFAKANALTGMTIVVLLAVKAIRKSLLQLHG